MEGFVNDVLADFRYLQHFGFLVLVVIRTLLAQINVSLSQPNTSRAIKEVANALCEP